MKKSEQAKKNQEERKLFIEQNQPSKFEQVFCCKKKLTLNLPRRLKVEEIILEIPKYEAGSSGDEEVRIGRKFLGLNDKK